MTNDASHRGGTELVRHVRDAWRSGVTPDLGMLLANRTRDDALWVSVLVADAECRSERGLVPTLSHYLAIFPWLQPGSRAVQELLAIEAMEGGASISESELAARYAEAFRADIREVLELRSLLAPASETRPDPSPGDTLGKYRLERMLGRGAFGQVWQAWDVELECFVALKLIGPSADAARRSESMLAEARASSNLNHPNVVSVRAAGRFPRPDDWLYIDMQLCGDPDPTREDPKAVAVGTPLGEIRARVADSWRSVARIMADVCRGVAAAHAQGVVHCDLKPANVLVTPSGRAMVADFGLSASAFVPTVQDSSVPDAARGASTSLTVHSLGGKTIRGTPAYMSPEQARGETAKPISDVYGLGAVLFWLLTGEDPYQAGPGERWRDLLERVGDETTPSPVPASSARPTLARICRKAMSKRAQERYSSASALQADLEAVLDRRVPPGVGPETALQPLLLWTRRNALPVSIAAVAMAGLATLTGVALVQRDAAVLAKAAEKQRADQLEKVSDFQSQMLAQIDTAEAGIDLMADVRERFVEALEQAGVPEADRTARVDALRQELVRVNATDAAAAMIDRTILTPAIRTIDKQFKGDPATDASLRQALADFYARIGLYDAAMPLQESALATRRRVLGEEHRETLTSINNLGYLLQRQGRFSEAEPLLREALEKRRRVLGPEHPSTLGSLNNIAFLLREQDLLADAEPLYREALEKLRSVLGEEHPDTIVSINNMGLLLQARDRLGEAEPYVREALEKRRRVLGEEHRDTITSIINMGGLLKAQGKLADAEPYYREALERSRRVLGEEHPNTLIAINNMGSLLQAMGKLDQAEALLLESLEKRRRILGEEHPDTIVTINNFGFVLLNRGRLDQAEPYFREALEKFRRLLGEEHRVTVTAINNMGFLLQTQGKLDEAEPYLLEALEKHRRKLGEEHPNTILSINNLGVLLTSRGEHDRAEPLLRESLEKRRRLLGEDHPDTITSIINMGALLEAQGKPDQAELYYRQAMALRRRVLREEHPDTLTSIAYLGDLLRSERKLADAEPYLREALDGRRRVQGEEHPDTIQSVCWMARLMLDQGKAQEALDLITPYEPAARKQSTGGNSRRLADFLTGFGRARAGVGYDAEGFTLAEANLLEAHPIFVAATARGPAHKDTLECVQALVDLYTAWDKAEPGKGYDAKAAEWKAKLPPPPGPLPQPSPSP